MAGGRGAVAPPGGGLLETRIGHVFPTVVGRFSVPEPEPLGAELVAAVLDRERRLPSWGRANVGGWHSAPDLLTWPEPCVGALGRWIREAVEGVVKATTDPTRPFAGALALHAWANVSRTGDYHALHNHPGCCWSGVYWVRSGGPPPADRPSSGALDLFDPRPGAELVFTPGEPYGHKLTFRPDEGTMVVFPSFLGHFVHPHHGDEPRLSIAFNVRASDSAPR